MSLKKNKQSNKQKRITNQTQSSARDPLGKTQDSRTSIGKTRSESCTSVFLLTWDKFPFSVKKSFDVKR